MRNLIEKIEGISENRNGVIVATKELPQSVRNALKEIGFNKSSINVSPKDKVSLQGLSGDGSRSIVVILNLSTGKKEITRGSWGGTNMFTNNAVDRDDRLYSIPDNGVVIIGSEGGGQPVWATIYTHPDVISGFLPEKSELTDRQNSILRMFAYTSTYRKELFQDNKVKDNEIDDLVRMGMLKKTSAGALSRTIKGKNSVVESIEEEVTGIEKLIKDGEALTADEILEYCNSRDIKGKVISKKGKDVVVEYKLFGTSWKIKANADLQNIDEKEDTNESIFARPSGDLPIGYSIREVDTHEGGMELQLLRGSKSIAIATIELIGKKCGFDLIADKKVVYKSDMYTRIAAAKKMATLQLTQFASSGAEGFNWV